MASDETPDIAAALKLYIAESSGVQEFTTSILIQRSAQVVPPFKNYVLIMSGRGGTGEIGLSLQEERVDIYCYGANAKTANDLWRKLDWYLYPKDARTKTSFTRANCRVLKVQREGGPLRLTDPAAADWPFTQAAYIVTYCGVPTA